MRVESFVGLRFLRAPRQTRSISVITWISIAGVMLGVIALVITISVMNGFRDNLFLAVTGTSAHARVEPFEGLLSPEDGQALRDKLTQLDFVEAVAPYMARQAFVRAGEEFRPVVLRGVEPEAEQRVSPIGRFLSRQVFAPLLAEAGTPAAPLTLAEALGDPSLPGQREGIVLGKVLAEDLRLEVGDEVDVISPVRRMTPMGSVPLVKRFRLTGVFTTGIETTDEATAYVRLKLARKLYRFGQAGAGFALRVSSPQDIDGAALRHAAPGMRVVTWAEQNSNIFQVMKLEKLGVFLILLLIIVVSFFNIVASLVMLVLEKRKAIAVLMSLGASEQQVRRVFFMQGLWIGTIGTLGGMAIGLVTCWVLANFDVLPLPPGVFPLSDHLPVRVELGDVLLITGASFLICMVVTLFPARAAARTDTIVHLRNE